MEEKEFVFCTDGTLTSGLTLLNPVMIRSIQTEGQAACWCDAVLGPDTWAGGDRGERYWDELLPMTQLWGKNALNQKKQIQFIDNLSDNGTYLMFLSKMLHVHFKQFVFSSNSLENFKTQLNHSVIIMWTLWRRYLHFIGLTFDQQCCTVVEKPMR